MRVCSLSGGDKRNALAREAQASVILPQAETETAAAALERLVGELKAEYGLLEKVGSVQRCLHVLCVSTPFYSPPWACLHAMQPRNVTLLGARCEAGLTATLSVDGLGRSAIRLHHHHHHTRPLSHETGHKGGRSSTTAFKI